MKKILSISISLVIALSVCTFQGCTTEDSKVIRIGYIPGLTGSALHLIYELNLIEKYAPDVSVELIRFESGVSVNEAFISNNIDVVEYSLPNFLIGVDRGIQFKISSASNYVQVSVQTNNPLIQDLTDVSPDDRIAVLSITGFPNMLIQMAAEQQLGNYNALEHLTVVMNTEEAELALINKSGITLHSVQLASAIRQNNAGFPTILTDVDILGEKCATFVNVASVDFFEQHPDLYEAYLYALEDAIELINDRNDEAIGIIAKRENISEDIFFELLDSGRLSFSSTATYPIMPIADFMHKVGLISNETLDINRLYFHSSAA
jgi:NitT/TauT family transport system substrate-binding protein